MENLMRDEWRRFYIPPWTLDISPREFAGIFDRENNQPKKQMSKYAISVSVKKTNQETGIVEDSIDVTSRNLDLDEAVKMRAPLIEVLGAWNKEDAE